MNKTVSPSKKWCFTLNNYTEEDINYLKGALYPTCVNYGFGKKIGENGTSQLQGWVYFLFRKRPKSVVKNDKIQWEKMKGTIQDSKNYCSKIGDYYEWDLKESKKYVVEIDKFYEWHKEIINILNTEPDKRTIYWCLFKNKFYEKITFQKYIFTHYKNGIILNGNSDDMKHKIITYQKFNKKIPKIVFINISKNIKNINYYSIEQIKDMIFYSEKYKGGMVCGACPHVFVFSDIEPSYEKISFDKIKIINCENN